MNFQKFFSKAKDEVRMTYDDVLRFMFSKKFVQKRYLFLAIGIAPAFLYAFAVDQKNYDKIRGDVAYKKQVLIPKEIDERQPMTNDEWKYLLSQSTKEFPR